MSADLPDRIRVKISSEAAGEISMSPVVAQELPLHELIDVLLSVCGKDAERIRELLSRGSVIQSASRFRWAPFEIDPAGLRAVLARFPDPDPSRTFDAGRCVHARIVGAHARIELPREIAAARRFLRRRSFWKVLMEVAEQACPVYVDYVYRDHADLFRAPVDAQALVNAAKLLRYSGLVDQVQRSAAHAVELVVAR